jgi:hypothetical protein
MQLVGSNPMPVRKSARSRRALRQSARSQQLPPQLAENANRILTFNDWCLLNGFAARTGRRILHGEFGPGPIVDPAQSTPHRNFARQQCRLAAIPAGTPMSARQAKRPGQRRLATTVSSQADFLHDHHRDAPVRCPVCDKREQRRARQQTYCSRKCRQRAHYDKSVAQGRFNPLLGKDTGLPTNPPKKMCNFNELQTAKTGSSLRICGPPWVTERELFAGRDWREATSTDGVVCLVASLRRTPTRSGGVP